MKKTIIFIFFILSTVSYSQIENQNRKIDKKLASLAIVASAIMNLDEFLTHG